MCVAAACGTQANLQANRVTDKLTHLSDRIYCCRSGSAADTQALADIITYHLQLYSVMQETQPPTSVAANLFQELIYQNKDRLSAGIIVAGWDKQHGGRVYNVPLGGGVFQQPWAIGGSGSTYIYGYCDSTWREDMSREETLEFVKNGTYAYDAGRLLTVQRSVSPCSATAPRAAPSAWWTFPRAVWSATLSQATSFRSLPPKSCNSIAVA